MRLLKSTPIFFVDSIEPHLAYWRDKLGYEITAEVPHGPHLGFVIFEQRGGQEVMLQTWASADADFARVAEIVRKTGHVAFFHEVEDLDAAQKDLTGVKLLLGPRKTFYGMREFYVQDPTGVVHGYAARI